MPENRPLEDRELDGLFAAARDGGPKPSGALVARVLADAATQAAAADPVPAPARSRRPLAAALRAIGGWPAAAGLAAAAVAGLAIGLSAPDTLDDLTGGYLSAAVGYDLDDLMPSYADFLGEG